MKAALNGKRALNASTNTPKKPSIAFLKYIFFLFTHPTWCTNVSSTNTGFLSFSRVKFKNKKDIKPYGIRIYKPCRLIMMKGKINY